MAARTGEFMQGCKATKIVGWNAYKLLEAAADVPNGRRQVMELLREASRLGFNTVRASHALAVACSSPRASPSPAG